MPETPAPQPPSQTPEAPKLLPQEQEALDRWNAAHPEPVAERPDWLPEKFKTVDDFVKSYGELETKLGELGAKAVELPPAPEGSEGVTPEVVPVSQDEWDQFTQEFLDTQTLSEASFKQLEQIGIPRTYAETYVKGLAALQQQMVSTIQSMAGGEKGFEEVMQWASDNLSQAEKDVWDRALKSNDLPTIQVAFRGIQASFFDSNPKSPKLIQGDSGTVSVDSYGTVQEMVRDISDPKYKIDPAFRKRVEQKVARSPF